MRSRPCGDSRPQWPARTARDRRSSSASRASARPAWWTNSSRRRSRARGLAQWLRGSCVPYGEGATFSALAEAIRRHAGILETDGAGLVEARLSAAVPPGPDHEWIRTRLRPLVGLPAPAATTQDNFAAWTSYFQQVAATAPTALVLEDLHWAGEDMLDFVRHLITQQVAAPLLVIATARTELLELHPGFLDACPGTVCLALSPLSPADMAAVAAEVAGGRLSDDTADFVAEQAGGNPLFGEEYVRLLVDRDLLRPTSRGIELDQDKGPPPLPDSVQAVIGARLDLLPAPLKATLSDAAVLGETFWRGGVAAIGGGTEAEADEALGALAGKQFVRAAAPSSLAGEPEYVFRHAVMRDVAYGRLPKKVRVGKHEAAGTWVRDKAGERADEFAEVLAYHYATAFELATALHSEAAAALLDPAVALPAAGRQRRPSRSTAVRPRATTRGRSQSSRTPESSASASWRGAAPWPPCAAGPGRRSPTSARPSPASRRPARRARPPTP